MSGDWEWYQIVFIVFMITFFCVGSVYVLEPQNIAKSIARLVRQMRGIEVEIEATQPPRKQPKPVAETIEEENKDEKIDVVV